LGAAALAGVGHVTSTLVIGGVAWIIGATAAARYGRVVNVVSALALISFGSWIAYGGWKESRASTSAPGSETTRTSDSLASRTALLLILGSSPMIEGIPAFLAAATFGVGLLAVMALVFAAATVTTYVVTCAAGVASLQRSRSSTFEKYGELLSGGLVAAVGVYSLVTA
jgi:hypothetical protein